MTEEIFALARLLGPGGEEQEEALRALCRAAAEELAAQLRTGLEPEACGEAFRVAAAWTALADLSEADRAAGAESFSAGDLTVRLGAAGGEGAARLRQRARELLAPYRDGGGFAFRGVRG